jgi:hypothetical protein
MASTISSRDRLNLALAAIMALGLAVAIVGGIVAIVRFGQPDGAAATYVAEASAWVFAAAFFVSFFLALRDIVKAGHSAV